MAVKLEDIISAIESIAPIARAYDWDNCGLTIKASDTVSGILIALDVTMPVVEQAVRCNCDMILTHHPIMFHPIKHIYADSGEQKVIAELLRHGISHYAAHTSFDRASGGMNDKLCDILGLTNVIPMTEQDGYACGRIGTLPGTMTTAELAGHIRRSLNTPMLRITGADDKISVLGVCGGGGGQLIPLAKKLGADAFLAGEVDYNYHTEFMSDGIVICEAGHCETEQLFIDAAFSGLQSIVNELQYSVRLIKADFVRPYSYY